MDGVYLINKPAGVTSRDVVNELSRRLGTKKIGHVGTLDPFATGLLIVVVGKATKIAPFLETLDKYYIATLKLGVKTDTLDLTGKIITTKSVPELTKENIRNVLKSFVGKLEQIPPMYSAIKYNGVPLYKIARTNKEIPRKTRTIDIHKVRLISINNDEIRFSVLCSKGTYIRTLGEQFAEKLGTVGHLVALKRTKIGNFNLKQASRPSKILRAQVIDCTSALSHMDKVVVNEKMALDIKNGKTLELINHKQQVLFVDEKNQVLAVYEKINERIYKCVRGLF